MAFIANALDHLSAAPDPGPLRYGLFTAANGPTPFPNDHMREFGFRYDPVGCGAAHGYQIVCNLPSLGAKTLDPNTAERDVLPFMAYASLVCGSQGYSPEYLEDKVRRRLVANEQAIVENAFWTGGVGASPPLAAGGAVTVLPAAANIVDAVAKLEAFAAANYGYVPVIHANSAVEPWAAAEHQVERRNPRLYTPLGSVWAFGGGYPGTGPNAEVPAAGHTWMFVTGQTYLWRSEDIYTTPALQTMNRSTNQYTLLAEREWAVSYDCVVAAIDVTLAVP